MNLAGIRPRIIGYGEPAFEAVSKLPLSPNELTTISLFFGIASILTYCVGLVLLGCLFLFLHAGFDLCDGYCARKKKQYTIFGAVYDGIVDRYVSAMVIFGIGLFLSAFFNYTIIVAFIAAVGSVVNSFSKPATYAELPKLPIKKGKIIHPLDSVGFFGLAETTFTILVCSILSFLISPVFLLYGLVVIAIGTNISLIQRLRFVYGNYNMKG